MYKKKGLINQRGTLRGGLQFLLNTKMNADCCFNFGTDGNVKIRAHKLILATASPVFRAMFYSEMSNDLPIHVEDIQCDIFQLVLDFIYTEQCCLPELDQIFNLYYAADKYMLPLLKKLCEEKVLENLNATNACKSYEYGKLFNIPVLMRRAEMMMLLTETSTVLEAASIEDIQFSTLLMLLDYEELNISSEAELFDTVVRWGRKECIRRAVPNDRANLRAFIDPALHKIRFLTYPARDFAKDPVESQILTADESLHILLNIVHPSKIFPMPKGFSNDTRKRTPGSCDQFFLEELVLFKTETKVNDDWPLKIKDRFKYLQQSQKFADCTFIIIEEDNAKPHKYIAHSLIVSAASLKFYALVSGGTVKDNPIRVKDVTPENFQLILDFIYSDDCNFPNSADVYELSVAADTYRLPLLRAKCIDKIICNLNESNAFKTYETAKRLNSRSDIYTKSVECILLNTSKALIAPSFEDIKMKTLLTLFNSPEMNISSEAELFHALMRWARKECKRKGISEDSENLRVIVDPALKRIRFLTFTVDEFSEGPVESQILTNAESLHILVHIVNPRTCLPMPKGFSTKGIRNNFQDC